VFSQAPVAIVVARGREFIIEMANPSYCALVNRDLVGRRFQDVMPELGSDVWEAFRRVMDNGKPFVKSEFYVPYDQNEDGVPEDHWFNVVYHPLSEPDGAVSGLVAVCSEVTAQVMARRELERANRELEEFAYVASHDLQEPLRTVNIYTQLLLERYIPHDEAAQEFGGFIRQGVGRMAELIKDLLIYSKVVHGDDTVWGTADLNVSLSEALKTMESGISESGAELLIATLPTVRGESSQLAHVFQNLLSNSLKYRRPNLALKIVISAERRNQDWIVAVQDNGIGFEPQYAQRIFGLFKRLHKDEFPGTGLGLAICQRIVEKYGGRMWAEGRPGSGATVYISLPECEAA
jgi:PAS domain S-box-containing protein